MGDGVELMKKCEGKRYIQPPAAGMLRQPAACANYSRSKLREAKALYKQGKRAMKGAPAGMEGG